MTYQTESIILVEIGESFFWTAHFDSLLNEQGLALDLDLIKIKRDKAQPRMMANQ